MSDTPTASRWRALVEAHAASGLPIREFAQLHQVNASSLSWWRSRLRERSPSQPQAVPSPAPAFAELTVTAPTPPPRCGVVLTLERVNVRVDVDLKTDLVLLRQVIEALA
jgi:transposase-like protein